MKAWCRATVLSFVLHQPSELADVDLTIARLKLLPYYQQECPHLKARLDEFESRLLSEEGRRSFLALEGK